MMQMVTLCSQTQTNDAEDKLTSVTWSGGSRTFTYDGLGRRKTMVTGGVTTTYNWDFESRITSITKPGMTTNTFAYNGLDARVSKVDSAGTKTFKRDGAYVTDPVLSDGAATYTPGVSERRSGTSRWLHSGVKNAEARTLSNQSVEATRSYDAFGNVTGSSGTWLGPFGYAGQFDYQEDSDATLQLMGHRYYDPSIGRFMSRDAAQDGRNWYGYCSNNPLAFMDRLGLGEEPWWSFLGSGEVWRKGLGTSWAALRSSLSLGFWDGGDWKTEPGFNESRTAWFVAEVALTGGGAVVKKAAGRTVAYSTSKLQHVFKHAKAFDITGPWSKSAGEQLAKSLLKFIRDPRRSIRNISYRGQKGFKVYVDPKTRKAVIVDSKDNLVSAWKLSEKQFESVMRGGDLR